MLLEQLLIDTCQGMLGYHCVLSLVILVRSEVRLWLENWEVCVLAPLQVTTLRLDNDLRL